MRIERMFDEEGNLLEVPEVESQMRIESEQLQEWWCEYEKTSFVESQMRIERFLLLSTTAHPLC